MTSSWPPKYYHLMPRGTNFSLIRAAYPLLTAPWSQPIYRQVLYQIPLLYTPACSFTGIVRILPSPAKISAQGVPGEVLAAAGCRGGLCPGVSPASPSGPSTATAERSNDSGSTSVKAYLSKGKIPFQVFMHVDKLPPELSLGCSCAGRRWCLKIINTDDIFP